ncbi:MAG TPA: Ig-like domain repeat protein [Terriglobia bacterium]|nr:Ig-like domain repeat protein [Terriglobia bacterium]
MNLSRSQVTHAAFLAAAVVLLSLGANGQTTSVAPRVTEAVDLEKLATLRGNTHPLARPENDRGAAPDNLSMDRMLLTLQRAPEQETALRQLLDEQQIKSSPHYHQWLTPEEFGRQFGPSDADIQATTDWLVSQGFQVNRVTAGRTVIEFSGTAGQVRQAMHTEIHQFEVNGKDYYANASDPQIPAALAPVVAGVASLNSFPRKTMSHQLGTFSRSKITGEVRPLFTFTDTTGTSNAVGPTDLATIYNVLPLWQASPAIDGTGQTIAIVGDSNINIQDARDFRSMFGLPARDPVIVLDGPDPGLTSSESEADLDVQWAGAVARNATIDLVVSADTETSFGADLSALYIVDNNLAPVMSDSFGTCEAQLGAGGNAFYSSLWEQAAAEGITVMVASGDSGSAECDDPNTEHAATQGLGVSGLASTPFNVSVGGTDFADSTNASTYWNSTNTAGTQSSAKSYIPEVPWNDSCARSLSAAPGCASVSSTGQDLAAGGGGPSSTYLQPSWQTGVGTTIPNDGKRHSPDISLFAGAGANGNFLVYCEADANTGAGSSTTSCNLSSPFTDFQGAGGTSFASPSFAGIMALVNQKTGARQGNANYVLYPLAAQAAKAGTYCTSDTAAVTTRSCIFYDEASGNISVACVGGSPNCSNTSTASNQFGVLVNPPGNTSLAWVATPGYDMATGLGSVNAANLVNNWASVSFSSTTTTLVSISPNPATHGTPVTVNITVNSGAGTPTGDVTLASGANGALGIPPLPLAGGKFIGTTTFLPGGTYSVTAHYAGDGTFGASDSTPPGIAMTVTPESSQTHIGLVTFDQNGNVTSTNATTAAYGSPYVFRVDVTNASTRICAPYNAGSTADTCPTGVVTLTDNSVPLDGGRFALNSEGYTEDILIQLPAGSHNLLGAYAGDPSFSASASAPDPITITKAATTLALSTSATTVQENANVTLTATLGTQSNGAAPTGTVQFFNGTTPISGTVTYAGTPYSAASNTSASLQATLTTSFSAAGTDSITAQFSNDNNYANSASSAVTVTVTTAPPGFTLTASPASISVASAGQSGTTTLTLSPTNGFTGAVNFTCTVPAAMAEATCSLSPISVTTSGNTTLTVTTTAPHTVGSLLLPSGWFPFGGGFVMVCLLMLSLPAKRRRTKLVLGLAAVGLAATLAIGCGGGSSSSGPTTDPGTPAGTYSITVTGTSGSITQTATVSVSVL